MLASLITAALLVGANAAVEVKPAQPTFSMTKATVGHHAKIAKTVQSHLVASKVAVPANYVVAPKASSVSWMKAYVQTSNDGSAATECTGAQTGSYFMQLGSCLTTVYDNMYMMSDLSGPVDGYYNSTTVMFMDDACATPMYVSQQLMPAMCDNAYVDDDTVMYVMGVSSKYSAAGFGTQSWNSEADCTTASSSMVVESSQMFFKQCYMYFPGIWFSVDSGCAPMVYTDADCTTALAMDDDDTYSDDYYAGDDFLGDACMMADDDGGLVLYSSNYCMKSAASMVSPSAFAVVAATAAAIFAAMM